jgi:hypothetical protein
VYNRHLLQGILTEQDSAGLQSTAMSAKVERAAHRLRDGEP